MIGMDIEAGRDLAASMSRASSDMSQLRDSLGRALQSSTWVGRDAEQFRSLWNGQLSLKLSSVVNALSEQAEVLLRNAHDQETVSNELGVEGGAYGGSVAGGTDAESQSAGGKPVNSVHHVMDMMDLAWAAMINNPDEIPKGWEEVGKDELARYGLSTKDLVDPKTGFEARVYRRADGHLAVSFRGTDDLLTPGALGGTVFGSLNPDMHNNVRALAGWTVQDRAAADLALKLRAGMVARGENPSELSYTGISLGGRNAMIAGLVTGNEVLATNPLNVSEAAYRKALELRVAPGAPDEIVIVRDSGDPVSAITPNGLPASVFSERSLKDTKSVDRSLWVFDYPKEVFADMERAHGMDSVRRGYRQGVIDAGNQSMIDAADEARKKE